MKTPSPALIHAFWTAVAAVLLQLALLAKAAGSGPSGMIAWVLPAMGLAHLAKHRLSTRLLADTALLVAVAGFGGLGMQVGGLMQAAPMPQLASDFLSGGARTGAHHADGHSMPESPMVSSPGHAQADGSHHAGSHHAGSHQAGSHHHGGSHRLWHLVPMVICCSIGCWWLCRVRPAEARPRDLRHHLAGLGLMIAGMYLANWILTPWLIHWLPTSIDMGHLAMVGGMVIGTAAGFTLIDFLDTARGRRRESGEASMAGCRCPIDEPTPLGPSREAQP